MDEDMSEEIAKNIGDIIVSVDKIGEQAEYLEHSYERELGFLVVHGFLHLNGYDHMLSEADEKVMFDLQREMLDNYGLKR
jgi:probable rRNA maturation factor